MSETRRSGHAGLPDVQKWQADFDELERRMDALREAFIDGVRSFEMTNEIVERIHGRFDELGEQVQAMHCTYPFGGRPGQEDCRLEPEAPYESAARGAAT